MPFERVGGGGGRIASLGVEWSREEGLRSQCMRNLPTEFERRLGDDGDLGFSATNGVEYY